MRKGENMVSCYSQRACVPVCGVVLCFVCVPSFAGSVSSLPLHPCHHQVQPLVVISWPELNTLCGWACLSHLNLCQPPELCVPVCLCSLITGVVCCCSTLGVYGILFKLSGISVLGVDSHCLFFFADQLQHFLCAHFMFLGLLLRFCLFAYFAK